MEISANRIKELREKTGAGMMDCKNALTDANGDFDKAITALREKGLASAQKKAGRVAKEGMIASYIHTGGKLGVLLEMNCETDFVARTEDFVNLTKDVAMQIAAMNPLYLRREDVPAEVVEKEKEIYRVKARTEGKPEKVVEKIVEGLLEKFFKDVCLIDQPFVKDPNTNIGALVTNAVAKIGENIQIRRFVRFKVGEGAE